MKRLKIGTVLIALGCLLCVAYLYFCKNEVSAFGDFSNGILTGLSIGCNFVGIILTVSCMAEKNKKQ